MVGDNHLCREFNWTVTPHLQSYNDEFHPQSKPRLFWPLPLIRSSQTDHVLTPLFSSSKPTVTPSMKSHHRIQSQRNTFGNFLDLKPEYKPAFLDIDLPWFDPAIRRRFDVIVIGTGPAGLRLAEQLSRYGIKTTSPMDSVKSGEATTITLQEPKANSKGKGNAAAPAPIVVTTKAQQYPGGRWKKGLAIFDFVLRLAAITAGLAATSIMGTTEQTLPFFTQFFQFHAEYNDLEAFLFFVVANGIASGYLILSLPFSIVCIVRPHATGPRLLLIIFDTVAMALTIASASAAASIVYLAHNGNQSANWNPICQQFENFCQQISSAVVASFITSSMFIFLIVLAAFALRRT